MIFPTSKCRGTDVLILHCQPTHNIFVTSTKEFLVIKKQEHSCFLYFKRKFQSRNSRNVEMQGGFKLIRELSDGTNKAPLQWDL